MSQQLHAAYILDSLSSLWRSDSEVKGLLAHLSSFEVEGNIPEGSAVGADPIVAVFANLIARGLPTRASVFLEDFISEKIGLTAKDKDAGSQGEVFYAFAQDNPEFHGILKRALHVIDPRVRQDKTSFNYTPTWEKLESRFEETFFLESLPRAFGSNFILQAAALQHSLEEILNYPTPGQRALKPYIKGDFTEQRVDFALPFPYPQLEKWGMVVEVDGPQHNNPGQKKLDERRDKAIAETGWDDTLRIRNIGESLEALEKYQTAPYLSNLKQNFDEALYELGNGLQALQLALTPVAVARIQCVLARYMLYNWLSLDNKTWRVAVIERDVPAAHLAMEDLKRYFEHLFALEGKGRRLPDIELSVFNTPEFNNAVLNKDYIRTIRDVSQAKGAGPFDVVLDCSTLIRGHALLLPEQLPKARFSAVIRSSFGQRRERAFVSETPVRYPSIYTREMTDEERLSGFLDPKMDPGMQVDSGKRAFERDILIPERLNALNFFLQTVFRKTSFRTGQLPIINQALQRKNVIGLLPTGGGKSLTYQLPALLQPGVCIAIDPIRSLMKDQVDGLQRNLIDAANYINSMLKNAVEREMALEKLARGAVLFSFISPERLLIRKFREALKEMSQRRSIGFSYAVVDEAHCVSEWGHDFRTAYLKLGENLRKYCWEQCATITPNTSLPDPLLPIIGLTATASYDVLTDIQRELDIDSRRIIQSAGLERKELNYQVISVPFKGGFGFDGRNRLSAEKLAVIVTLLNNSLLNDLSQYREVQDAHEFFGETNGKYRNAGLIFCPHRDNSFGVLPLRDYIQSQCGLAKSATFSGGNDDDFIKADQDDPNIQAQEDFLDDRLNLLVATKAFGMGIDKKNIRYTIHFNYPNSIESFYQEAGRAGRDRSPAMCYILYSGSKLEREVLTSFHNNSFKGSEKDLQVLEELLNEIERPVHRVIDDISEMVREETGLEVSLGLGNGDFNNSLFANYGFGKRYGHLNITTYKYFIKPDEYPAETCRQVMETVVRVIQEQKPEKLSIADWLNSKEPARKESGIIQILESLDTNGAIAHATVGFWNDQFNQIAIELNCTESQARRAYNFTKSPSDFIENLSQKDIVVAGNAATINNIYPRLRDEQDTFKAIYRLGILGVVGDYEVDYHTKTITCALQKKSDEEYINHLYQFLLRYVSVERAREVYQKVKPQSGNTIKKCLEYLVGFVYQEVAAKREASIKSMEDACQIGQSKGPDEFKELLNIHFYSKYYLQLVDVTNRGREFDFDLVWEYANTCGGNVDNLKHLRGACVRVLTEQPSNGALLLLKAYATLLLDYADPRLQEDASNEIMDGFSEFLKASKCGMNDLSDHTNKYKEIIKQHNPDISGMIDNILAGLYLRYHTDWLKIFNQKFLLNYA